MGGCDKQIKMWQAGSGGGGTTVVGMHDAPVKDVIWVKEKSVLASIGWDNTLRYSTLFNLFFSVKSH